MLSRSFVGEEAQAWVSKILPFRIAEDHNQSRAEHYEYPQVLLGRVDFQYQEVCPKDFRLKSHLRSQPSARHSNNPAPKNQ